MNDEQPLLFPLTAFSDDAWGRAQALVSRYGGDSPVVAALRGADDLNNDDDRAFWVEVRRACKFILHYERLPLKD